MSENWKVQASFKFGPHQQGLLNVRADSAHDLKVTLHELANVDALGDITSTYELIGALDNASTGAATAAAAEQQQGYTLPAVAPSAPAINAPAQPQAPFAPHAPAAVAPPSCIHGSKSLLTKPSKNKPGEYWTAWACPADQHNPTKCQLDFNVPDHLKR